MKKLNKEEEISKKEEFRNNFIKEKITKKSIESNIDINLIEGTEAYYSERYGWTLRKIK